MSGTAGCKCDSLEGVDFDTIDDLSRALGSSLVQKTGLGAEAELSARCQGAPRVGRLSAILHTDMQAQACVSQLLTGDFVFFRVPGAITNIRPTG